MPHSAVLSVSRPHLRVCGGVFPEGDDLLGSLVGELYSSDSPFSSKSLPSQADLYPEQLSAYIGNATGKAGRRVSLLDAYSGLLVADPSGEFSLHFPSYFCDDKKAPELLASFLWDGANAYERVAGSFAKA